MYIAKYIGGFYSSEGLKWESTECDKLYDKLTGTLFIISVQDVAVPQFGMNQTVSIHYEISLTSFVKIGFVYPQRRFEDNWEIISEFDEKNVHSFIDALNIAQCA